MLKTLVLMIVISISNLSVSDTQPTVEIEISQEQVVALNSAESVVISVEHAKLRSCKNNVSGLMIFCNGKYIETLDFGPPSFNKTGDYSVVSKHGGRYFKETNKIEFKPVFTDKQVDGCWSLTARRFRINNGQTVNN